MTYTPTEDEARVIAWLRREILALPNPSPWQMLFNPFAFARHHAAFMALAKARKAIEQGHHHDRPNR